MPGTLADLLGYLDRMSPRQPEGWRGWHVTPVFGGANNRVYRVASGSQDYAVKFTICDSRDRAGREHAALSVLAEAGLVIAPRPVLLDRARFSQPVVVQTWVEGAALSAAPTSDADWATLLDHYCAIHAITPAQTTTVVPEAFLNASTGAQAKALVYEHLARLPEEERPPSLCAVIARFDSWAPPTWPRAPHTLCRVDPNWRNFIRRPGAWASVDWENSGWGDPAFEIADLMTHPAYESTPPARWRSFIQAYAERCADPTAELRIRTYTTMLRVWWVVRSARYLYEVPRGLDPRLPPRPDTWRPETERHYVRHVALARAHLEAR